MLFSQGSTPTSPRSGATRRRGAGAAFEPMNSSSPHVHTHHAMSVHMRAARIHGLERSSATRCRVGKPRRDPFRTLSAGGTRRSFRHSMLTSHTRHGAHAHIRLLPPAPPWSSVPFAPASVAMTPQPRHDPLSTTRPTVPFPKPVLPCTEVILFMKKVDEGEWRWGGWRPARLNGDAGGSPLARVPVLPFRPGHRPRIPRGSNHGAVLGMFSAIFLTFCEAKACGYSKALALGTSAA